MKNVRESIYEKHLRIAELIRIALMDAFRKGKVFDIRIKHDAVSITKVNVSSDFKVANCFVRLFPLNNSESLSSPQDLIEALEQSKFGLRKWIAQNVSLKYTPEIKFTYDHSLDNLHAVDEKLRHINAK